MRSISNAVHTDFQFLRSLFRSLRSDCSDELANGNYAAEDIRACREGDNAGAGSNERQDVLDE